MESSMAISPSIVSLLEAYRVLDRKKMAFSPEPTVNINEVLGSVALFYERVRNAIDYKGEHLQRRNAIERIIKRRLWEKPNINDEELAYSLIKELTWARYIKNNTVTRSQINKIASITAKYRQVFNLTKDKLVEKNQEISWKDWLWGIASCEIETVISPNVSLSNTYVETMYSWFKSSFAWENTNLTEKTKDVQIFIAIHRSLPKSDEAMIRYHILTLKYPLWPEADRELIERLSLDLPEFRREVDADLNHPIRFTIYRFIQKHTAPFQILKDILEEDHSPTIEKIFASPQLLEEKIRSICETRYAQIREVVNRGIIRSVIYIFVTKILFALALEIPYESLILRKVNLVPIGINVIVPPLLMFLVGLTIKTPGEDNTERLIERINAIVNQRPDHEKIPFTFGPSHRNKILSTIFSVLYIFLFLLTFGFISYILFKLHFTVVSGAIFFGFLSLVLLFAFRVRFSASELKVTPEKQGLIDHLIDNLTLPFLNLGVILSAGLARLNFLIMLMDFLIEAPLKNIIGLVEDWTSFLRERKEEVVEVPMQ